MPLAEGVSSRLTIKPYASGAITANTNPVPSSDPGASDGQILRRVSTSIKLGKDTYQSGEVRSDRQIADFRHGTKRVTGSLSGELSPSTYWDLFEAAMRGTATAAITLDTSDLTSVAANNGASTFTFGGGNPVTLGLRVGMIVRFTNLSDAENNDVNYIITSFSTANNRTMGVFPAPDTMTADTSFSLSTIGQTLYVPAASHVSRKFAIEIYNEDIDLARLYTECRIAGFTMQLPASGLATIEFPVMGRDMFVYESGDAPFFTAPTAATTTGIFAAVNGLLQVNGVTQGVVTSLNVQMDLSPSSDPVVGQNIVPEVFLGRANVTGQLTAFLLDGTLVENFTDEDEISILAYLTTSNDLNSPAMTIYLPRVKFNDADIANSGEGGQSITMPFQALKADGLTTGDNATTIRIVDTEAA